MRRLLGDKRLRFRRGGGDLIRPVGREGSGGGVAVTTPTPRARNKRVRNKWVGKAVEKWEPPVEAPNRLKKK